MSNGEVIERVKAGYVMCVTSTFSLFPDASYFMCSVNLLANTHTTTTFRYRLSPPVNCPPEIAELMLSCLETNPEDRPSFEKLFGEVQKLRKITTTITPSDQPGEYQVDSKDHSLLKTSNYQHTPEAVSRGRQ